MSIDKNRILKECNALIRAFNEGATELGVNELSHAMAVAAMHKHYMQTQSRFYGAILRDLENNIEFRGPGAPKQENKEEGSILIMPPTGLFKP